MTTKNALLIGASGGIGSALMDELTGRGWSVTGLSRTENGLDVTDEASVHAALEPLEGPFQRVFIATGALVVHGREPEKAVKEITAEALLDQFKVNALGPMMVLKHVLPKLAKDEPATIAALSARVGSIGDNGIGGWHSYRTSKAALNQLFHGAAIELKRTHKKATVLTLHPGTVATDFTAKYAGRHKTVPPEDAASNLVDVIESKGPDATGGFFDYAGKEIPLVTRLVLVLGDQVTEDLSAIRQADQASDVIVMAEVVEEATYVRHHAKKIAYTFAVMRHFAEKMRAEGWQIAYTRLDANEPHETIASALLAAAEAHDTREVLATRPGEWRLIEMLEDLPLDVTVFEDDRFVATEAEFLSWAEGRKELRMEWFYREMRRKTGLLMDGNDPVGGKWNFDHDNRKPAPGGIDHKGPMSFTPDDITNEVLDLVETRFPDTFGTLRPFDFAVEPGQARRALSHFVKHALPRFGDYQDAMMIGERTLYHSVLSLYMQVGLLDPLEVCRAAEEAHHAGDAPINAVEGFIRQIIGWRDYMRHIWYYQGPDYERKNGLNHQRKLPEFFWSGETDMRCIAETVEQTRETAYAHHIQRLMVTGNFFLLAGIDPAEVYDWYMSAYIDAYGWVMAGNVIGMSQFADGGVVASKPYVSSANYIAKMSDYCSDCAYSAKTKTGEGACPFNLLYWAFLDRHRDTFKGNPRMGQMYATWDRMKDDRKETILTEADAFLKRMSSGARV